MKQPTPIETVDVTSHLDLLMPRKQTVRSVTARLTPEMYPIAETAEHHWLNFTTLALNRLRAQQLKGRSPKCGVFWSCGSSHGLDAVIAMETLAPEKVIITDIIESLLEPAKENILHACPALDADRVDCFAGDLTAPIRDRGIRVDLAYANLPVLPIGLSQEEINRRREFPATFYPRERLDDAPAWVQDSLLQLYYSFLTDVRECLTPTGGVMCSFGARQLWAPLKKLFEETGFKPKIMSFGIKPQEQTVICLRNYERLDGGTRKFVYFPYNRAMNVLRDVSNGRTWNEVILGCSDQEIEELNTRVLEQLKPIACNVSTAQADFAAGIFPGHLVYCVYGSQT